MENNEGKIEFDLKRCLFALWSQAWIVILAGVIVATAAFSYAYFTIAPTYSSSVKVYVNNKFTEAEGYSPSQLTAAKNLADTYMVILKSRSVLDKIAEKTDLGYSSSALSKMITAYSINDTEVFAVVVTSTNYKHAAAIANTVLEVLPDRISEVVEGSSVQVVDYAEENPNPVGPSYQKYGVMGAAVGVILSAALIVLLDITDTTINTEEYLNHVYPQYPLLAIIPGANNGKSGYYKGYKGYYRGYYQSEPKKKEEQASGGDGQ